ncbi:MAG: cytochrome-c oxidase, cbb3-type subunit III [Pseudomonadota bacterium]
MSNFWHFWIAGIVLIQILGAVWLLFWTRKQSPEDLAETDTMDHEYDGIRELNMPLPKWWLNLFYITIIFALVYLVFYPGFGAFPGILNWSSKGEWQQELNLADRQYSELFKQFSNEPIETLIQYEEPIEVGQRIFTSYCTTCHGTDARGAVGFPNLTDKDWLYGGTPKDITTTLIGGRAGNMPSFSKILKPAEISSVAKYVANLSSVQDPSMGNPRFANGEAVFTKNCAACHGQDGKGNQALGAPNLTDNIWLYGGNVETIITTLQLGRNGRMPAHLTILGEDKIHVVAAYVYSLSNSAEKKDKK